MDHSNVETGTIISIRVENFVTYDNAVIKPGRNLNVIIGPNGTGKSTIVCAIVLGLGGKPNVIGRARNVGDYVKSGCLKAKIEIELNNPGKENYVISRIFTTDGHTTWMLNDKTVTSKEIEALTKSLNIQVSNLCQFLPQDKVQDFSKMNAQELLENTEKSVGDPMLLEYHHTLKEHRKQHIELQELVTNKENLLGQKIQTHERLEEIVSGIKERTAIKKKITCLKQKKAWLLYDVSRERLVQAKKMRDEAMKDMNKLRKDMKPIEKIINAAKSKANAVDHEVSSKTSQTQAEARTLRKIVESIGGYEEKIREIQRTHTQKIQAEATYEQEIAAAQQQKSKLENDLEIIMREFGDEESLTKKQRLVLPLIEQQRNLINQITNQIYQHTQEEEKIIREIRIQEAELQSVEGVEKQRLALLRQMSADAYKGVMWLRGNADKFSQIIHEPMLLKINVKSAKYSKYFESVVPSRDLCAFVCENKQDMNMLMTYLRDQQRLQINCVHSDPDKRVNMSPRIPIESIAQYGFEHYLSSLIDAPQTILKYLVSMYRINNIPIGNQNVEQNIDYLPNSLSCFYSEQNAYYVSVSKYTGEKSTRISRVGGNGTLSIIIDTSKLGGIRARLLSLNDNRILAAQMVNKKKEELKEAEAKMEEFRVQRGECQNRIERIKNVRTRIIIIKQKINDLQTERTSIEQIERETKKQINDTIQLQVKAYEVYNTALELYITCNESCAYAKLERRLLEQSLKLRQKEYCEMKAKCDRAESIVQNFETELQPLKAEAKRMYEDALNSTNNVGPEHQAFEKLNKAFSKLPPSIDEINEQLKMLNAKVFCLSDMPDGDNVINDFEKVKVDVARLKEDIVTKSTELRIIIEEMERIRGMWMPLLSQFVDQINENFSSYLANMNCAGEVSLHYGDNILDFEQYGLKIKVKFRDTDELQELTRHHQSGGERAVSTAVYMIALQELSVVPFRCVDEINQGMDATNERRVFELIVSITGKPNGSQYFLLTPKLLPNLLYTETAIVHCVFNGPFSISHQDFDMNEYCQKIAYKNHRDNDEKRIT
ncbi:structural maintenance of chromosomes protein 5 [Athalia rosae]|uniref:structural maintenance of chromosomes protein 5 n=1 Tax=Athalia rosae TaxID=37344 RepID=UPI0020338124|nr:structural maintenance of chromosomes protein 5 [Athalia rosae]